MLRLSFFFCVNFTFISIAPVRNFKHALHLVNVVADNRYHLFQDFLSEGNERLGDYLAAVRLAVLKSVESGGSDPFKALSIT